MASTSPLNALRQAGQEAHERLMEELGRIIDRDQKTLQTDGHWFCEKSLIAECVYDMNSDEGDEECLFCGKPSERS